MIHIAISAFFVWLFFKIKEKETPLEGFAAVTLVLAPALVMMLVSAAIGLFKLPEFVRYFFELSYFVIPFFIIKAILESTPKKAAVYAGVVFAIVMLSYVPFVIIQQFV